MIWRCTSQRRGGFTITDLLVSMGIVSLLVGIMLPTLSSVRETARRVVCGSNIRQIGLGIALYADDNAGIIPASIFRTASGAWYHPARRMHELRVVVNSSSGDNQENLARWDGLGNLFSHEYLLAPGLFYCPSHHGQHPFAQYEARWRSPRGLIVGNYHYRGFGANGERRLWMIEPQRSALVVDSLASLDDYNHGVGANVLRANFVVNWYSDPSALLVTGVPTPPNAATSPTTVVDRSWQALDGGD